MRLEEIVDSRDRETLLKLRRKTKDYVLRQLMSRRIAELARSPWMPASQPGFERLQSRLQMPVDERSAAYVADVQRREEIAAAFREVLACA